MNETRVPDAARTSRSSAANSRTCWEVPASFIPLSISGPKNTTSMPSSLIFSASARRVSQDHRSGYDPRLADDAEPLADRRALPRGELALHLRAELRPRPVVLDHQHRPRRRRWDAGPGITRGEV